MAAVPPLSTATGGDSPGQNPLTIGAVVFNTVEAPQELNLGAVEQRVVEIELLGGGKIVDTLGIEPKSPITWKGKFWGSNDYIEGRVQQLRSYAVSGQQQTITYLSESWTCIVKEFTPTWKGYNCEYEITVAIVSGAALSSTSFPTVNAQVDGNNDAISSQLATLEAQVEATAFLPVNEAWQLYLAALGILFTVEQQYQTL